MPCQFGKTDQMLTFRNNTIPTLNKTLDEMSCFSLFTMLLLLHHSKHLTPTQKPLGSTFMLTKLFRFEDSMIVVEEMVGWGDNGSEL
jgi:hypothetical protein